MVELVSKLGFFYSTSTKKNNTATTLKADNDSNNNVSIFGMPEENDWILNGLGFDPLVRDYMAYYMSRQLGNYASRTQFCEGLTEITKGCMFSGKIKADGNRVDVLKLKNR
jgi:hypothetical protein